jgi:hypothetical protein
MKREYRRNDFELHRTTTAITLKQKLTSYAVGMLIVCILSYLGGIEYVIRDWMAT